VSTPFGTSPAAPDWSTSYSQFLARSTAQSAKTLKLYQEALECVAQRKLAPTVFQDYFPRFAQAHGSEYATKIGDVGAKFLSDLVRSGSFLSREQSESDRDGAFEPEMPPRFDPANPYRWYEQLAEYAGRLNGRAVRAYRKHLDRVAAGETTPSEVQQNTSDYLARQLPDYLQHLTQLYFDLLNGLNEIRADYEEDYFRGVLAIANPEGEPPVVLHLTGLLGTSASASLSIANTTGEQTAVNYSLTDVRRLDGQGPAFVPRITITPEHIELEAGEEGSIHLSLLLEPNEFDPGVLYTGTLYISGNANLRVEVQLRITAIAAKPDAEPSNSKGL
jgi:hypothetical protein